MIKVKSLSYLKFLVEKVTSKGKNETVDKNIVFSIPKRAYFLPINRGPHHMVGQQFNTTYTPLEPSFTTHSLSCTPLSLKTSKNSLSLSKFPPTKALHKSLFPSTSPNHFQQLLSLLKSFPIILLSSYGLHNLKWSKSFHSWYLLHHFQYSDVQAFIYHY